MSISHWIRHLTGSLPPNLQTERHDRCIIRLSDTHCYAYYLLNQLFEQFQVIGIIHTGGLSASIDMRLAKHMLLTYEEHISHLATICDKYQIENLWIRPKDQDHIPSIKRVLPHAILIDDHTLIILQELHFTVAENDLVNARALEDYTREHVNLWQFRQLMQGVKFKSQIELINIDQNSIISYALSF